MEHDRSTMKIGTDAVLLAALTETNGAQSILDIGCGCGVIGFCLAQLLCHSIPNPVIYGVDADADSILEARQNAKTYRLLPCENFHFIHSRIQDFALLDNVPKFDLIVSNPPFFNNDLKPIESSKIKSKHRDWQLPFDDLIKSVVALLNPAGRFSIILPTSESQEFHERAASNLHCCQRIHVRPTVKKPVHRVVQEYVLSEVGTIRERHLTIRDERNEYTEDYRLLVKPYLLS